MGKRTIKLDRIRVPAPCPEKWDTMTGGERVRLCEQCDRNVFNLSNLTRREAETLITNAQGRTCVRYSCGADGRILTKDSFADAHGFGKRASLFAASLISAILGIGSNAVAQTPTVVTSLSSSNSAQASTSSNQNSNNRVGHSTVSGAVYDPNHAVIVEAKITLTNSSTNQAYIATTNEEGVYKLESLIAGNYVLKFEAPGFRSFSMPLTLGSHKEKHMDATLDIATYAVGVFVTDPEKTTPQKIVRILTLPYRGLKKLFASGS